MPILKGKEGEYAALEALRPDIKGTLMPLIEIPEISHDFTAGRPSKTLDDYLADVPERLKKACGTMPFFIDLTRFDRGGLLRSGQSALESVLVRTVALGGTIVPIVTRTSTPEYLDVAKKHSLATGSGISFRLIIDDFGEDVDLDADVQQVLASLAPCDLSSIDLVIDMGDLGANSSSATLVARSIFSMIPNRDDWRRMILAAASFPKDLSDVSAESVVKLPRYEWTLWKTLQRKPSSLPRRDLIFGDYTMANPVTKSLDPRTMQMSANIRYTTEDEWLIIKGRSVRRAGFDQYFDLCRTLVERPEYSGRNYSWGDGYISDCADAMQGPGNATTWRKVGVNHHLTLVTRGLANLLPSV